MGKQENELIAEWLINGFVYEDSPFHVTGVSMPYNPITGKSYRGMNALWLSLQGRNDPRWVTRKQALNQEGWRIPENLRGTEINVIKTTKCFRLLAEQGKPQSNHRNKRKTKLVTLPATVETQIHLFNATNILGIPNLEVYENRLSDKRPDPSRQLTAMVVASKVTVRHANDQIGYDAEKKTIYLPKPEFFDTRMAYDAALLYELVKYAGQEKRLFDPMSVSVAQKARPVLAALFLGSKIGIHSQLAKETDLVSLCRTALYFPDELEKATNDAQDISDHLHSLVNFRGQRQGTSRDRFLQAGDKIMYRGQHYEVMNPARGNGVKIVNHSTGFRFKVTKKDVIYGSLLAAKQESLITGNKQYKTEEPIRLKR